MALWPRLLDFERDDELAANLDALRWSTTNRALFWYAAAWRQRTRPGTYAG
jgi:hypothetical protein